MAVARPSRRERSFLSKKIREFRTLLGKTQEQFAALLPVSSVSVARYETNHIPATPILHRLAELAQEHQHSRFVDLFRTYESIEPAEFSDEGVSGVESKSYPGASQMRAILRDSTGFSTDRVVRIAAAIMLLEKSGQDPSPGAESVLQEIERILTDRLLNLDILATAMEQSLQYNRNRT